MADKAQALFKKIVVHNKMMKAETADQLLAKFPNPKQAIQYLVKSNKLSEQKGNQLLGVFQKQLAKLGIDAQDSAAATASSQPAQAVGLATTDDTSAAVATVHATGVPTAPVDANKVLTDPFEGEPPPLKLDDDILADEDNENLPVLERDTDDSASDTDAAAPTKAPSAAAKPRKPAGPVSDLMIKLLKTASKAGASDVHVKSGEIPILRKAGRLVEMPGQEPIPKEECKKALLSLLTEDQCQQFLDTHDLDFCYDGGEQLGRFRANLLRQNRGVDGIFRLIPNKIPKFEDLNMPPAVKKFTEYKQGIVLVTGPKASGKTTTLAAMVDLINSTRAEHIITVEDPIEFVHPCKMGHVNQREVGSHTKTFSNALRAALREAPDVIMVGEMRDLETTSLAITAAETGHLVFATLHTPDALRTIDRVLDVFPPREQGQIRAMISESMRGIISQLLVPSTDGQSQELCVEILVNTLAIGNLIRESKTFQLRGIMQTGRKIGMQLMDDSLIEKAVAGKISAEDAVNLATERDHVEKKLSEYE